MVPDSSHIKITDNRNKISSFINDLVLQPRLKTLEWSAITKQTPNIKVGYTGQHLASLITGVEGKRTGARGDDLEDGTEVKSCTRVDQLDTCLECGSKVLRLESKCSSCGSSRIERKDDSKWLFTIRTEEELDLLTNRIDRIFLNFSDYPNFEDGDFNQIRFQAFEIWNTSRHSRFEEIMVNYYNKLFLEHKKRDPVKTPAPKNFWPYNYQFYLCNPVMVFSAIAEDANTSPKLTINHYIEPNEDRDAYPSLLMPTSILYQDELVHLLQDAPRELLQEQCKGGSYDDLLYYACRPKYNVSSVTKILPYIDEELRVYLNLRDTDKASTSKSPYRRR